MNIKRGNTVIADVYLQDSSYVTEEIMGDHTLTLNFLSRNTVDLQINDYVEFEGATYKIRHNEKVTKRETSLGWEYTVVFYSGKYDLQDVVFFLHGEPERKKNFDYYTGTASQWLGLFIQNMNRESSGWQTGSCIESEWITLSFKDKSVGAVLDELIKQLNTEYWISGKTISIGKREYASNGLVLGQGEGMGFKELEVSAVDETPPITVLYPYGSDKNLGVDYGSDYLLLPGGRLSLEKNVDKYGRIARSVQFDQIYPKGEFTVTQKIDTLTLKSDIDFKLTDCLLKDTEVIVTFQTGGLAGYDLAIVEGSWDNATKQFKLKENKDEKALTVPGDINFSVGDKFILTSLKMPQSYIDKASKRLLEEAQTYLDSKCEKRVQLRGKCDDILFKQNNIFIACGQMIGIYSEQLKIDREIRVTKIKRYIENDNKPTYRYDITLSDFLQGNGFKDLVDDVESVPDEIQKVLRPFKEWTKRSWKDVMQTFDMMFDPEGEYFTEKIKPLAVHTAQLVVGTNSQQMDLVGVRFSPNADNDPNYFKNTSGKLVHFTVNETDVREWSIPATTFSLNGSIAYYVYAKCPKSGTVGAVLVSDRQIKLEQEAGYYHFWIGVLNTPENNVRSWLPNYGYTEIAGQTITTGIIKDKNANIVIDLNNGTFTGYGNFTDKPDLSVYAYKSELKVAADEISATVTRLNKLTNRIDEARWITKADGNTFWASSELENGDNIISYINQTATTVTINASRINLQGELTISMFSKDDGDKIVTKDDLGKLAYKDALTIVKGDLSSDLKTEIEGAMQEKTYIYGGLIKASLIEVDKLYAKRLAAIDGTIAGLKINSGSIYLDASDYSMAFNSAGYLKFTTVTGANVYIGSNIYSLSEVDESCNIYIKNTVSSGTISNGVTGICIKVGRAAYMMSPQTWLKCTHAEGWGSQFIIESRYFGDDKQEERTCINVGELLTSTQVQSLPITNDYYKVHTFLPVYIDLATQYLCVKV